MDVCAAALWTFHLVVVGFQAALLERLLGKITHKEQLSVLSKSRGGLGQLKQQAGLGLPSFFAGVPETVVAYLMKAFGQYVT